MFIVAVYAVTVSRHIKSCYLQYQSAALVQYHNMLLAHECVFIFALVLYSWTCTKNHLLTLKRQRVFSSVRYFAISLFLTRVAVHRSPLSVKPRIKRVHQGQCCSNLSYQFIFWRFLGDQWQLTDLRWNFSSCWNVAQLMLKITELNDASFVNSQLQILIN